LTNNISDKDKKDWEKFIISEEKVTDKDSKSNLKTSQKSKYIDLHGYSLEEANKKIEKFIIESYCKKNKKNNCSNWKGVAFSKRKKPICIKRFKYFKILYSRIYQKQPSFSKNDK
jgi:DNA-nicking Smr family endonuclease